MHQRVADHASEKSARERAEEDLASAQQKYKKLKERQDAAAASGGTHTALELEAVAERNKLQVSTSAARSGSRELGRVGPVRGTGLTDRPFCDAHVVSRDSSSRSSRDVSTVSSLDLQFPTILPPPTIHIRSSALLILRTQCNVDAAAFCKDCLDARIASRQRKCPACGVAFSKEEVQTLYWQ